MVHRPAPGLEGAPSLGKEDLYQKGVNEQSQGVSPGLGTLGRWLGVWGTLGSGVT